VLVAPLILGPKNCESATGWPWRWVRDTARGLGVPFVGYGQKRGVLATTFLAALEKAGASMAIQDGEPDVPPDADPAEVVRRALGKRRRRP
jgi:hypothetical protein